MDNNNNIESKFHSVFNLDEIETEDWNVPSEMVWVNIEQEIKKKKRRRFFFWYWLPTLLLVSGLLMFWKATTDADTKGLNEKSNSNGKDNLFKSEAKSTENQNLTTDSSVLSNKQTKEKLGKIIEINRIEKKQEKVVLEENASALAQSDTAIAVNIEERRKRDKIDYLANLSILPFNFLIYDKTFSPVFAKTIIEKRKFPKQSWLLLNASSLGIANQIKGATTQFEGEELQSGYSLGFVWHQNIRKKLFFEVGAQYSQFNYKLNYELGLPFNGNGEVQNPNGNFDNTYNGAVSTSLGELKMQMVLERQSNATVLNGEKIIISAVGGEKFHFLRLPLSLGYTFSKNHNRLIINGKVTAIQTVYLKNAATFNSVHSHHNTVKEKITVVTLAPSPSRWTPEIGLGVSFQYRVTPRIQIGAESFISQSIRPMYQNSVYKNLPLFYGIGLNIGYRI